MADNKIIIYKPNEASISMEVKLEDDTVWLNRHQISNLFDRDIKTIGKHITNAIKEELQSLSVVAKFATTASDGKVYQVEHYNLDVIISVGYRVKSKQGIQFRIWANKIIKDYLLKGYAINNRINKLEEKLIHHDKKFDLILNTNLPKTEGIFFDGQIFDAYAFVSKVIKSANKEVVLIDNYIDESVLLMLSKCKQTVKTTIYTSNITKQLKLDLEKYNSQYSKITIKTYKKSHDRFLIIDKKEIYHIGASLKDLGKKWFAFSKIEIDINEMINKLRGNENR